MRDANRLKEARPVIRFAAAGAVWIAAGWMVAVAPGMAQDARTGVSLPDSAGIVASPEAGSSASAPAAKPSAAVPAATTAPAIVYGPYVPYRPNGGTASAKDSAAFDPDANIVTEQTAGRADRRALSGATDASAADPDAGIVTYVPSQPGEVPDGTLVKVKLREELSTLTTKPGTRFSAEVSEPVMRDGRVVVPEGSMLEGRVTWVRGGRRIGGQAAIHLEPESVMLPDGSQYVVRARAIDTDTWQTTRVDREGTIMRRDHAKATLGAMGLATGGAMAAGAVMGGLPGALIGAGVGAGASAVVWLKQDRQAELPVNFGVVFSLTEPMRVTPATAEMAPLKIGAVGE